MLFLIMPMCAKFKIRRSKQHAQQGIISSGLSNLDNYLINDNDSFSRRTGMNREDNHRSRPMCPSSSLVFAIFLNFIFGG